MKKLLFVIGILLLTACSNQGVSDEGDALKIAVIGEKPEMKKELHTYEQVKLEEFNTLDLSMTSEFDAVLVTPSMFGAASDDQYVEVYKNSNVPIIFFDSPKRHFPFVNDQITYETAHWESLNNGSHTTIYLNTSVADTDEIKEDAWYFYLENEKSLNKLYEEVLRKVREL